MQTEDFLITCGRSAFLLSCSRVIPWLNCNDYGFVGAMQGLYRQMVDIFKGFGVEAVPGQGSIFDPNLHEAIMREPDNSLPEGTVIQEFRKGFKIGDKLIRAAMVKVILSLQNLQRDIALLPALNQLSIRYKTTYALPKHGLSCAREGHSESANFNGPSRLRHCAFFECFWCAWTACFVKCCHLCGSCRLAS